MATCSLLSITPSAQAGMLDSDLNIENSIFFYNETNGVSVVAPQVKLNKTINEDNSLTASVILDSITGATATGEVPYGTVQTVTSASGNVSTRAASTKPSLKLKDNRTAISLSWNHQLSRLIALTGTVNDSTEGDYQSKGSSLTASLDSEDRFTTWSLARSFANDDISRSQRVDNVAGIPAELTDTLLLQRQSSSEKKHSTDTVFGLTQVLTSETLLQLSLTNATSDGYMSDPYKLISVVDNSGSQVTSYYEKRPSSRSRKIFYSQLIQNYDGNVLRLGYRHHSDDWGITSNTLDAKYKINMNAYFIESHFRYYQQSSANFHQYYLKDTDTVPDFASADSRLAAFTSNTIGVGFGFEHRNTKLSARLEYMRQQGDGINTNDPGKLKNYDLFNGIEAYMIQLNYSILF